MNVLKPNKTERTIITIVISIAFGMLIGVLSMKEKLEQGEFERKLLILNLEELSEMNHHLSVMPMEQKRE